LSQRIVLELLKELGGKAKIREISNLAKIKYPESCLYEFVGHKLERLASWGYVHLISFPFAVRLSHYVAYSAFPLNIKMSTITIAERPIATNPAGINEEAKESTLNLPAG
jgi:hypothetical protein